MSQRRVVRTAGRPVYGRPTGLRPPRRRWVPGVMGLIPRRVIGLLVAGMIVVLILQQVFRVKEVTVTAPSRAGEIKAEVQELMAAQWQQQNLLTLNSSALTTDLARVDSMVKSATVRRHWPQGLELVVSLKQPSLGWMSGNQTYLLDRDGSAIGAFAAGAALPVVIDGSNLPVELGQRVVTARFVGFATDLAAGLSSTKLAASRYEVKDTTFDLYVTTNKGYRLIFDTSRPAAEQVSDLNVLLGFLSKQNKVPAEYIDLRIAGKAYYK